MHFFRRRDASHELEGVMTRVVSTNVAFDGTLLNQDTRLMVEQSKVGTAGPAIDGALVLEYEDMLTGKRWKLSRSQCLCLSRIKIRKVRRFPNVSVPQIHLIGDLEGECVMSTGGQSIGLLPTNTIGHALVELTSSRIQSPPRCVGNRNSPNNNDDTGVVNSRAEGISVNDLKAAGWRVCLEATEGLMHILAIGESALQSKSNRFCSRKSRSRVHNDRLEDLVSAAELASMGSFEVVMDRREVLEERDVEVMLIDVRIRRKEPVVERVRVERVTPGRIAGPKLLPFIGENIPSGFDHSTPTSSIFVSGSEGGHEVFRGTQMSTQIGGVLERKEVDVLFIRPYAYNAVAPGAPIDLVQLATIYQAGPGQIWYYDFDKEIRRVARLHSIVLLELDHKVLCSMWSAPISSVPKSGGTS